MVKRPDKQVGQTVGGRPDDPEADKLTVCALALFPVKGPDFVEGETEESATRAADEIGGYRRKSGKIDQRSIDG
jgi:hypothetical protein